MEQYKNYCGDSDSKSLRSKKIVVGIIPLGTGNDWAKSIEIPKHKESNKKNKGGKPKKGSWRCCN